MNVRALAASDLPALAELYRSSVRGLGPPAYTSEQIAAWSSWPDNGSDFNQRLHQGVALVSTESGAIAAFAQSHPADYVALLYTGAAFARCGHATALYAHLENAAREQGVRRLHTVASYLSCPFFEKQGFVLFEIEPNHVFKGVPFERFKMEKPLPPAA